MSSYRMGAQQRFSTRKDDESTTKIPGVVERTPQMTMSVRSGRILAVSTLVVALAACGSSGSGSKDSSAKAPASSQENIAGVAGAQAAIAPYMGKPTAFPGGTPLGKKLPAGTSFVFLQCGAPLCAIFSQLLKPAVQAIGGKLTVINAGFTAASSQAAASSALALKPAAVLVTGVDPALYGGGLKKLSDAGTKVISLSISKDIKPFGITFNYAGVNTVKENGWIMADWVIAKKIKNPNVVFYGVPGLDFSPFMQSAFKAELTKNCPSCKLRTTDIDLATLGTTSPQKIVTDLQAHPDTNIAVFAAAEAAQGLPAAMKAADVSITTIGCAPEPNFLQDISNGEMTAGLAVDLPVTAWTAVDAAARLILEEPLTAGEKDGLAPQQILEKADMTFDPSRGWSGYPDFAKRFVKLWTPS